MVSVGLYILETIAAIETVFNLSQQYVLMHENNATVVVPAQDQPMIEPLLKHDMHQTSIHHYARHGLCRTFEGKKNLYTALKTKLCNTKSSFIASFVIDLCRRSDDMLDKWVKDLFDIDDYALCTCARNLERKRVTQNLALNLDKNVSLVVTVEGQPGMLPLMEHNKHYTTIHHYARHGLCRNDEGQRKLYTALQTQFCNTKLSFTADFVIDLCGRKDEMLDKWVGEMFDLDGDGYVSHHEKQFYNYVK